MGNWISGAYSVPVQEKEAEDPALPENSDVP
jgi:hypothetical protein